jgi:hypothetical protein
MKKEIIYSLKGIYREDYQIEGYRFGGGEKSACIVGALRGNESSCIYVRSLLRHLKSLRLMVQYRTIMRFLLSHLLTDFP